MDFRELVRKKNLSYQWYERQAIARQRAMTKRGVVPVDLAQRYAGGRRIYGLWLNELERHQADRLRSVEQELARATRGAGAPMLSTQSHSTQGGEGVKCPT